MAIKFQYNKTALQQLEKQLNIRVRALPTIKNKESALRIEVKKAKDETLRLEELLKRKLDRYNNMVALWGEFDSTLVAVEDVELGVKKIAGVKTPVLNNIVFATKPFSVFNNPKWYLDGIALVKEIASVGIEKEVFIRKMQLLDRARKKTTQKVNLFEKVQIPGYEDAIRKIKRFMEDEDNLSKSAQKIVKTRQMTQEEKV
ncbi:MAG: V-type ATP synthase subunit D [Bacteroidales bacterium]|nr:V-type ATP synthase subunit D [Bacteroidales bacterium]MBN2761908.1 V-type ATP synthase subunit D [Bacteroidales bacterium]